MRMKTSLLNYFSSYCSRFSTGTDSNSMGSPVLCRLYNGSKIRAVNDSVRVLRETFCSRRGVVKLFTTLIRRYNGAAGYYIGRSNERTVSRSQEGPFIYSCRPLLKRIPRTLRRYVIMLTILTDSNVSATQTLNKGRENRSFSDVTIKEKRPFNTREYRK